MPSPNLNEVTAAIARLVETVVERLLGGTDITVSTIPPEKAEDPFGIFFPGEEFVEIWGVDIGRGFAVASDMNTGLWVFKVR